MVQRIVSASAAAPTRFVSRAVFFVFVFSLLAPSRALAVENANCKDVAIIFARGSGQNPTGEFINDPLGDDFRFAEKESYAFFKNHTDHLSNDYPNIPYKAVSIHDFPGKYDPLGYQAVGVGLGEIANTANADASWVPGDYQASVKHGVAETTGYLRDQIATCPNQYFIVGGYSQGAQVMGESLFQLTSDERSKILGVGFFGDPKYVGSTEGVGVKPALSFPWRRGEATNKDTGMLEPRFPYVPVGIEMRTLSWCNRHDIVCGGWSAYRKNSSHSAYSESSIGYAVNELVTIAAPQLLALDRKTDGSGVPPVQLSKADKDRERDVMFVMNDNSNSDVLNTFRYSLDPTLDQFVRNFTGTRFAAKSFGEHDYGFSAPRVDNIQSFLPYAGFNPSNPVFTSSNLTKSFATKYPFGQPIIGGGDIEDPYQLAIERAVVSTGWRDDLNVERNIVLITDRPPKDPYEYNICNGTVRQWMHFPDTNGYKNCYTNYHREVWQKSLLPETCETILKVIIEDTCTNPLMSPHYVQMNKRTLEDEIKLAQAYRTKISIVIPYKFAQATQLGNKLSDVRVRDKLRGIAEATGGTFVYYDTKTQFNSTSLYDTLWRVFTKQPRSLSTVAEGAVAPKVLAVQTNTPTIFDVSRSGVVASNYKWDFDDNGTWDEVTQGPVTQHEFTSPNKGILRVQATSAGDAVLGETRQIYTVSEGEMPTIEKPNLPEGITAAQQANGTVLLKWIPEDTNQIIVFDSTTNLPVGSTPLKSGSLTLPSSYDSLAIRAVSDAAASDPVTISVVTYTAPIVEEEPCCELQEPSPVPEEQPILQGLDVIPPQVIEVSEEPQAALVGVSPVFQPATITTTNFTQRAFAGTIPIAEIPQVAGLSADKLPAQTFQTAGLPPQKPTPKLINWWVLWGVATTIIFFIAYRAAKRKQLQQ